MTALQKQMSSVTSPYHRNKIRALPGIGHLRSRKEEGIHNLPGVDPYQSLTEEGNRFLNQGANNRRRLNGEGNHPFQQSEDYSQYRNQS